MPKKTKPNYRSCFECGHGMSIKDTRYDKDKNEIYRRYRCSNKSCNKVFSTIEIFLDDPRRATVAPELLNRTIQHHGAVLELLREISKGRTKLYGIEAKLLEVFNKGISEQPQGEVLTLPKGQRISADDPPSDARLRHSKIVRGKEGLY